MAWIEPINSALNCQNVTAYKIIAILTLRKCRFRAPGATTHTKTAINVAISTGIVFIWSKWGFLCYHAPALSRIRGRRRCRGGALSRTEAESAAEVWLDGSAGRNTAHARRPRSCARIPLVYRRRVYTWLWPLLTSQPGSHHCA